VSETRTVYIVQRLVRWSSLTLAEPFNALGDLVGPGGSVALLPVFDNLEDLERAHPGSAYQTAIVPADWGRKEVSRG
jgi:hypothetical protein